MSEAIPTHIGLILDGNRRWAKQHNLPSLDGHKKGAEVLFSITLRAFERGVQYVSAFVFSTENWKRTDKEVGYLMNLITNAVDNYLDEYHERGVRIIILGRRDGLRSKVIKSIEKAEAKTKDNTNGTLALCLNYGGKDEIVDAVKEIIAESKTAEDVDVELVNQHMYHSDIPDIDMIIRTSGEHRLSGFMMWRAAYAELYFCDSYWPAFTIKDLDMAVDCYMARERRFGA